ncbi:hypothetical protein GQ457_10G020980 [Hibiscus cannabinus]
MAASGRQALLDSTSDPKQRHRLVVLLEQGQHHHQPIETCPVDSVDHMPCEDPMRNSQLRKEMIFYRERHCPLPDEMPLCLIPPLPGYKISVQWLESLHKKMAEAELSYEEMRRKRLEENKKRMEELNLKNLSQALKSKSPKSSPGKPRTPRKPVEPTAVRRSSRVADMPKPNYKDVPIEPLERLGRSHSRGYSRRDLFNRVYASVEERAYATERAEHLESTLESGYPSFVKPMLQSHVTGGFWLGLPNHFCKKNLPHHDVMMTLVDEEGEEFAAKYLADKTGLSGGWRGFSIDHNLVDGDALVFQLVAPTEFKVYIVRAYNSEDRGDGEEMEEREGEEDEDKEGEEDEEKEDKAEDEKEPDVQNRRSKRIRARK